MVKKSRRPGHDRGHDPGVTYASIMPTTKPVDNDDDNGINPPRQQNILYSELSLNQPPADPAPW